MPCFWKYGAVFGLYCIRDKFKAAGFIETLRSFDKTEVAFVNCLFSSYLKREGQKLVPKRMFCKLSLSGLFFSRWPGQ